MDADDLSASCWLIGLAVLSAALMLYPEYAVVSSILVCIGILFIITGGIIHAS